MTLEQLKKLRYQEIDATTGYIINQGFVFDGNTFSLSPNAQINWTNIILVPDVIFPITISTVDENTYSLQLADKTNFYNAAVSAKTQALFSGSALKKQIYDCTDEACVNAVVDNRI